MAEEPSQKSARILRVDEMGLAAAVEEAARSLCSGGLVVFPASGLYGLGADGENPAAVERVFAAKARTPGMPLLVLVAENRDAERLASRLPPAARALMDALWPGGVTLVLPASNQVAPRLTGDTGKIGVRRPAQPVALALCRALGRPLVGTSANLSGRPGCREISRLDPEILAAADLILDAGPLTGQASTVVDTTVSPPVILREGAVPGKKILEILGQKEKTVPPL
ncbi:MAG: threonylcarbamoyl-AMP synthase [Proteobacteria bacterium]|nr:threonylcarbamoyl-AMP synthase [Pseudomonadota bacterium]